MMVSHVPLINYFDNFKFNFLLSDITLLFPQHWQDLRLRDMTTEEKLLNMLKEFEKSIPDINFTSVTKFDGFPIVDTGTKGVNPQQYSAMTAGLHGLSKRILGSLDGGDLHQSYVKGDKMEIIVMTIPERKLFLCVITKRDPNLGLIIYEMEKLTQKLLEVL